MSRPAVSVILPTYNRADLLPRAIKSIIAQTLDDWEIVLVDDGSTDETGHLARDYERRLENRFVYVPQSNAGAGAARNHGIEHSRGQFVTFLDSDDEYMPNKLERQMELFDRAPALGLVYCDSAFVDLKGKRHESVFDEKTRLARQVPFDEIGPGLCVCRGSLFDWLIREYFVSTISGMVRRDVLVQPQPPIGGLDCSDPSRARSDPSRVRSDPSRPSPASPVPDKEAGSSPTRINTCENAPGSQIRFPTDQPYAEEWLFYLKISRTEAAGYVDEPLCLHHFTTGSLARTDRRANHRELRRLLLRILETFNDLSRFHLRAVHNNLASVTRQQGYDAYRNHHYASAARHFMESFRFRPQWHTVAETVQASCRALWPAKPAPTPEIVLNLQRSCPDSPTVGVPDSHPDVRVRRDRRKACGPG